MCNRYSVLLCFPKSDGENVDSISIQKTNQNGEDKSVVGGCILFDIQSKLTQVQCLRHTNEKQKLSQVCMYINIVK